MTNVPFPLPERIEAALIRGVGAYLRTADQNELPPELKRLRSFRPQALAKHKNELLRVLEEGPTAALILQWMDETKPPLSKGDLAILRAAAQREEGWREALAGEPAGEPVIDAGSATAKLRDELEREKARAVKARVAERAAKEALKEATENARLTGSKLSREVEELRKQLAALQQELEGERRARSKMTEDRAREKRRSERELDRERKATQQAEAGLKEARRTLRERDAELRKLRAPGGQGPSAAGRHRNASPSVAGDTASPTPLRRRSLKAPPGLLDDNPKTLDQWLKADNVQLLVDGYNVSKSVTGFAHLSLEDQRKRVVQAVNMLARKNGLVPIVVFDGAQIPPGVSRRARGPALVEYSTGEIADDHLIARLENLPADPVVFVTDDRELQRRARALGATVASSGQLLALAR